MATPKIAPKSAAKTAAKGMDGAKAFERFLPQTRGLPRVMPLKADAALALKNVGRGVEAVMRFEIRIRRELPKVDVTALRALPDLARAVVYAASEVERAGPPRQDLKRLLSRARVLRELLLSSAESLGTAGILDAGELAKIRSGLGPLDSARDCVALAALFRRNAAAVKGKTPVKTDAIDEAEELGTELLGRLDPKRAARPPTPLAAAVAARDGLWTLLVRRHDALWRVGAYLKGREVESLVPPLQSGPKAKRKREAQA